MTIPNLHIGSNFLVVGRAGMDLYSEPIDTAIEDTTQFSAALGGSAANIAVAIVKNGSKAALVTCVSDDAVGRYVRKQIKAYGIDDGYVATQGGEVRTSLAVVETRAENCQAVIYRNNAADFQLDVSHVARIDVSKFGALIVTGTSLALEPSRSAVFNLVERANLAGLSMVLDIDYRAYSWPSPQEACLVCGQLAALADIVVGNDVEFDLIAGKAGAGLNHAREMGAKGKIAIYKMGGEGSVTFSGILSFQTPVFAVKALKPTGAGDAFLGTVLANLSKGRALSDCVIKGSAAAAIVVTKVGCAPATPDDAQIEAFIKDRSE